MAIVKVKIRMKDAEFEAEGSREDVDAMLGVWWDKVLKEPNDTTDASGSSAERVNDFATPGFMNLLCRVVAGGLCVSPVVADLSMTQWGRHAVAASCS